MSYNNSIGVIYNIERLMKEGEEGVERLVQLGLECVQLNGWNAEIYTQETADTIKNCWEIE